MRRDHQSSEFRVYRHVLLPAVRRGLQLGVALVAFLTAGSLGLYLFGLPLVLDDTRPDQALALALALLSRRPSKP